MGYLYISPAWFAHFSIILQIIFSLVCFTVSLFSFRVYRLTEQREHRLFSIAFLSISISYLVLVFLNIFLITQISEGINAIVIERLSTINLIGVYSYIVLFTIGIITLLYTVSKVKSPFLYFSLIFVSLLGTFQSKSTPVTFYIFATVYLFFILLCYLKEYDRNKTKRKLTILIAFFFLWLSFFDLIFSTRSYIYYIIGHVLELIAYLLILASIILSLRK